MFDPRALPKKGESEVRRTVWCADNVNIALEAYAAGLPLVASPFLPNSPMLRRPGLLYEWSKHELNEARKCQQDILYFADTYIELFRPDATYGPITLRPYQREYLKLLQANRFVVFVAARQIGKTVTSAIFLLWCLIFVPNSRIAILGDKMATATENITKIKAMYERLPFFLKPGITTWNKSMIGFDNGSYIFAAPCNLASVVGRTLTAILFDEMSIPDDKQVREVVEFAFPAVTAVAGSRIICISSPRGMQHVFSEIYHRGVAGLNGFAPFKVEWYQVPGRDEAWKAQQVAVLGQRGFDQQYGNSFLTDDDAWLDSEASDRLLEASVRSEYVKAESILPGLSDASLANVEALTLSLVDSQYAQPPGSLLSKFMLDQKFMLNGRGIDAELLRSIPVLIAIDTSEGKGKDYTTISFSTLIMPEDIRGMLADAYASEEAVLSGDLSSEEANEADQFGDIEEALSAEYIASNGVEVRQFGAISTNSHGIEVVALFIQILLRAVFDPDKVKIVCEIDGIGAKMRAVLGLDIVRGSAIDDYCFARIGKDNGVRMGGNKKRGHVYNTKQFIEAGKLTPTFGPAQYELARFREVRPGVFQGVDAHDDWSMNCVNIGAYMSSPEFMSWSEEAFYTDDESDLDDDY